MRYGYDVSNYQADHFPLTVGSAPVDFVVIKITEGTSYTSPAWVAQRQWARDHGIPTGFYHFARPGSMTAQADFFLSKINLVAGDFLVLDWEDQGVSYSQKDQWIKYVKGKAPGHRTGLYCNGYFWTGLDKSSYCGDFFWPATAGRAAGDTGFAQPWTFHQYSTANSIDHDVANFATKAALVAWLGGATPTPEDDMALDSADITKIADAVYTKLLKTDGVLASPADASDHATNPFWAWQSHIQGTTEAARGGQTAARAALAQSEENAEEIQALSAKLDVLAGDPDGLVAKLKALLDGVTIKLNTETETG
jgi:hypothetical protein